MTESTGSVDAARLPSAGGRKRVDRVPELDLLRFMAASSVVFYHFTYRPLIHGVEDLQAYGALQAVSRFGYLGVNLFFMISGFVILWSSQQRSATEFVISRIARLYPSFWVCVLLTSLVVNLGGLAHIPARTIGLNLTMLPSLFGVDYVDGVYWTLFIELKFYLLVFIVLVTGTMKHVERWMAVWLAVSLAGAFAVAPRWLESLAMYPFGPYFISGCLVYLMRARGVTLFRAVGLAVTTVLAARHAIGQQPEFIQNVDAASGWVVACVVIAFHIAFAAIALRPQILPDSRLWYWLGGLTYPLYLLHNRIGKTIWSHLPGEWSPWAMLLIVFGTIYLLSWAIAAVIERKACSAFHRAMVRWVARIPFLRPSAA